MNRALVSWPDLAALGGRQEGDPPGKECLRDDGFSYALVLPESGSLVLRVLWRHLGGDELGAMDVPTFSLIPDVYPGWMLTLRGQGRFHHHDDILDPCEALAAIVKEEARITRGGS